MAMQRRRIEIPQSARMFKANYSLKVHNSPLRLTSAFQDMFKLTSHRPKKQQYKDVYMRTKEIPQRARIFKANYCLKELASAFQDSQQFKLPKGTIEICL